MSLIRRTLLIGVALLLVATFVDRFVLIELLARRLMLPLLLSGASALAAIGAGHLARRRSRGLTLDFAVGYPLFGTLCFLLGAIGINMLTMLLPLIALGAAGVLAIATETPWRRPVAGEVAAPRSSFDTFALVAITVVVLAGFVAAQAPPSTLDELAYHLAIPHTWVTEGRAIALPLISHSYFPLGVESADLPQLYFLGATAGGIASHLLHLFAAIAAIVILARRSESLLVAAAIVATPALALTAGWSLVDWPLLAVCAAFLDEDDRTRCAALAAGLLTKYTFVPFAIVALVASRRWRHLWPGVLAGCIFFVRNTILTGNPVAPFLSPLAPHVSGYRSLTLGSYIFDGRFIDESLGASLLALLPSIGGAVAIALVLGGALLWASAPSARLLIPFFGVAALRARIAQSRLLQIVVATAVCAQLLLVAYFTDRSGAFSLISGTASEEQYLAKARASYASVAWIDGALPPDARALVIGLNETYWFTHRVRGGGNFDAERLSDFLDAPTPEALRHRLASDGITHVAVVTAPAPTTVAQKLEERRSRLSPGAQRSVAQLLDRYAASVVTRGGDAVYQLRPF